MSSDPRAPERAGRGGGPALLPSPEPEQGRVLTQVSPAASRPGFGGTFAVARRQQVPGGRERLEEGGRG